MHPRLTAIDPALRRQCAMRQPLPIRRQSGLSLIELMVSMVIALLAVIVISQVLFSFEGQRRTTTSGSDAQLTGTLAVYTLQRELQMAGYGLTANPAALGCTIRSPLYAANGGNRTLAPIVITDGGATAAPDSIRILASSKASFSVPTLVTSNHPQTGAGDSEFGLNNTVGIEPGDLLVAVPPVHSAVNTCLAFRANGAVSLPGKSIGHAFGAGDPNGWNAASKAVFASYFPAAGYPAGSHLVNLGAGLVDRTYSVAGGVLQSIEYDVATLALPASATEVFPQVRNLQALYGKDTNGDGTVDRYDGDTPTTQAGWVQVIAVRIAMVVRSDQFEKEEVTSSAPEWDLGTTPTVFGSGVTTCSSGTGQCIRMPVNAGMTTTDWKRYRYKVYDTVIPLRNVLWRT